MKVPYPNNWIISSCVPPFQKDFFLLKELEKQCQKEKGITSMSVKDILMSLVDDGMVGQRHLTTTQTYDKVAT